mgnify:CR=1 FL=1
MERKRSRSRWRMMGLSVERPEHLFSLSRLLLTEVMQRSIRNTTIHLSQAGLLPPEIWKTLMDSYRSNYDNIASASTKTRNHTESY